MRAVREGGVRGMRGKREGSVCVSDRRVLIWGQTDIPRNTGRQAD